MERLRILWPVLLISLPAAAAQDDLDSLLVAYFETDSLEEQDSLLSKLADHAKSKIQASKLLELARKGSKSAGARENKLSHKDYPGSYFLTGNKTGKKVPLFISLHGGGSSAGDSGANAMSFGAPKDCLAVFPTVLVRPAVTEWNAEREARYILALIEELKRSFDIDTNRVYLSGLSMGGWGTFCIGSHHADVFAALAPCAAGVCDPGVDREKCSILENLRNTPIRFYHGERDSNPPASHPKFGVRNAATKLEQLRKEFGGYESVYKEYPGLGHAAPPEGFGPIFDWLLERKRDPLPAKVVWQPHRRYARYFYWLKVKDPAPGMRIEAEYDRKKNSVELRTKGVESGLTVFLNDRMLDLKKPVTVTLNGERKFSGKVQPSLSALVESIGAKRDPEMVFTHRVDF